MGRSDLLEHPALHPDRIRAVAGLSVPFFQRGPAPPLERWNALYGRGFFYQLYFQAEGVAEADMEADVRTALRKFYDPVRTSVPGVDTYAAPGTNCTDFRGSTLIDGKGHWIQQEAPGEVNSALLRFLGTLG